MTEDAGHDTPRHRDPVRHDLVAHVRELVARDPEHYVAARLPYVLDRLRAAVANDQGQSQE